MDNRPTVSVILPVRNRRVLVRRAIESVLAQTRDDLELIVVDDASTDGSDAVVAEYLGDPRVRLHRNETNLGAGGARNRGIALARGTYIAFQDSDDRWFPEKLARQLAALEAAPDRRICICGAVYFSPDQCYFIPRPGTIDPDRLASGDLSGTVLASNPVTPQTLLVHRSVFEEVGVFDADLPINEDWELAIRMSRRHRFVFVLDPMVMIYRTPDSVSSNRLADAEMRALLLRRYADAYADAPEARAHQNYLVGCLGLEERAYGLAFTHLHRAFRTGPTPRRLLQILRAYMLFALRAGR